MHRKATETYGNQHKDGPPVDRHDCLHERGRAALRAPR